VIGWRRTPLAAARWVVVDCETSGLDTRRDRLLSVAAVEVADGRIALGHAYAAVVRQETASSPDNILVHGLGGDAQLGGRPCAQVLNELAAFMAGGLPVAYHAPFDREILRGAFAQAQMRMSGQPWLDLAVLAPLFFPGRPHKHLDGWLAEFSIDCPVRHDALSDAYATAQLLLVLLAEAHRQRIASAQALLRVATSARWLPT
jgi:DNA polymerase-3 subunit epsilon